MQGAQTLIEFSDFKIVFDFTPESNLPIMMLKLKQAKSMPHTLSKPWSKEGYFETDFLGVWKY